MLTFTEEYVDSLAPNASAVKNGWGLVKKNQFVVLQKSEDGSVLFGECIGSGKNNYLTSFDFIGETPTARCTCPSRQFPCKHSLGLLYSFLNGANFTTAPIPEDIIAKRAKAAVRREKKKEQPTNTRKVNKSALTKKLKAQLEGLDILDRQLQQIVRAGFASVDGKKLKGLEETAKQLGNYYLKELQNELREFQFIWKQNHSVEEIFSLAFEKVLLLYSITKKGKEHLTKRLEDQVLVPDTGTSIEEKLGHIWQLAELREQGMTKTDVELVQLSFSIIKSDARKEFIDLGVWLDLADGQLYFSKNYRPYRAAKHIKEDDSIFPVASIKELFIYPGEGNRRIRWDEYQFGPAPQTKKIISMAKQNVAEVLKQVRGQLRLPLADKYPVALISFSKVGKVDEQWVLDGQDGTRLTLTNGAPAEIDTLSIIDLLSNQDLVDGAMLVQFYHELGTGALSAKPLTMITPKRIVRLLG